MEATQAVVTTETFEQFMAGMREIRKGHQEFMADMQKLSEGHQEFMADMQKLSEGHQKFTADMQKLRESQEATDRQMKENDRILTKRFSELGNRFGDMVEYMVLPNLVSKFEELGFTFTKANRTEIKDKEHNIFAEVDAFLENGDKVMIVETKSKPSIDDINDHIERMQKLRRYADLHNDKRTYLGAIAGVVFSDSEKNYALKKGFYVIEPSGDTFNIIEPKGNYHPHEW